MSRKRRTSFYVDFYLFKDYAHVLMSGSTHSSLQTLMLKREKFTEKLLGLRHVSRHQKTAAEKRMTEVPALIKHTLWSVYTAEHIHWGMYTL